MMTGLADGFLRLQRQTAIQRVLARTGERNDRDWPTQDGIWTGEGRL